MRKLFLIFPFLLVTAGAVFAQPCPFYPPQDRVAIKSLFSTHVSAPPIELDGGIQAIISRMNEISYLCSFPFLKFPTQRLAFEMEYQAWLASLDQIASNPRIPLTLRGRVFVRQMVNSSYLGVTGTTVTGGSESEAIGNAQAANQALTMALSRLWRCF